VWLPLADEIVRSDSCTGGPDDHELGQIAERRIVTNGGNDLGSDAADVA
jgi:hypothetical protein